MDTLVEEQDWRRPAGSLRAAEASRWRRDRVHRPYQQPLWSIRGGVFLALPAIFCAGATLIEKHEIRRKREAGLDGRRRGEEAAALDAAGAALGALGMLVFATVFSSVVERSIPGAFIGASLTWLAVSLAA
jgi:hypothetical protein